MSRYHSYLNSSAEIIRRYSGDQPFAAFLKSYFSADKKYGSKDRKQIGHLCYCYFRTGKIFQQNPEGDNIAISEKILFGLFLCSTAPNELLQHLKPEWNAQAHLSADEKFELLNKCTDTAAQPPFVFSSLLHIFPWKSLLSEGIDHTHFCKSFLTQPDLFIRIRPGNETSVRKKLQRSNIPHRFISENCIAIPNNTKLDTVLNPDEEVVIQDYSSQRVATFLEPLAGSPKMNVWDCCAASGGKSILANDILKNIKLTVSDIRKSILLNLEKRFAAAGIKAFTSAIIDITHPPLPFAVSSFDLIICDAPCSGSGTWARTPEQLFFWEEDDISHYTHLQKTILSQIIPFLKPGAHLLYITCSVFEEENEKMVNECISLHHLKLLKMELLKGYDNNADTLFAALLMKPT